MVTISTRGYNVAKVGVNGVIDVDTPTNVGTKKDFNAIVDFAKTGYLILRTKFKKSGQTFMFDGSVDCEIQEDGSVFFSTLTEETDGDDVTIQTLTGTFSLSGSNCVMNISEAEVGGGGTPIVVDDEMSDSSENPVQNKVIKGALDDITELIPSDASVSNKLATKSDVDKGYVEVTGDGAKTYKLLLTELYALVDTTKLRPCKSFIVLENRYYLLLTHVYSPVFYFNSLVGSNIERTCVIDSRVAYVRYTKFSASTSTSPGGETDMSSNVPDNGSKITLYY